MTHAEAKLLADQNLPLIEGICKGRFRGRWQEELGDMYLRAIEAFQKFDETRGSLKAFLYFKLTKKPREKRQVTCIGWEHGLANQFNGFLDVDNRDLLKHLMPILNQRPGGQYLQEMASGMTQKEIAKAHGKTLRAITFMIAEARAMALKAISTKQGVHPHVHKRST